jgi:hypothetical protein
VLLISMTAAPAVDKVLCSVKLFADSGAKRSQQVLILYVNFETFDNRAGRILLVGMTRVQQQLEIFMTQCVEDLISEKLQWTQ